MCCQLGGILYEEGRVLYESDNFFVAPTIGLIGIEGYLLMLSKNCFHGFGAIPEILHQEAEDVLTHTKRVLRDSYGVESQVFEHGPKVCNTRGGSCFDHAHLHIVPGVNIMDPLASEFMRRMTSINDAYRAERIDGWRKVSEIVQQGKHSYFMAEEPGGKRVVIEVNYHLPSQFMRRIIGQQRGTDEWDFAVFPQKELFERTLDRLRGRF